MNRQRILFKFGMAKIAVALGVAAAFHVADCASADAHAIVVRAKPQDGETVTSAPSKVELWYDAPISSAMAALSVTDAAGQRVDKHDAAIDGAHVTTSVEAASPGEYTIRYRAISADGHIVSGILHFTIKGQ
jgi:methionine-rich copper-binding protein CopC